MSDSKPDSAGIVDASSKAAPKESVAAIGDPSGKITNRPNGEGTRQTEPTPEQYPAAAKVAPPAVQLNTAASSAVGSPAPIVTSSDAINAAQDEAQQSIDDAIATTDKQYAQKAKDDGLLK